LNDDPYLKKIIEILFLERKREKACEKIEEK